MRLYLSVIFLIFMLTGTAYPQKATIEDVILDTLKDIKSAQEEARKENTKRADDIYKQIIDLKKQVEKNTYDIETIKGKDKTFWLVIFAIAGYVAKDIYMYWFKTRRRNGKNPFQSCEKPKS